MPHDLQRNDDSNFHIGASRGRRMASSGKLARVLHRQHSSDANIIGAMLAIRKAVICGPRHRTGDQRFSIASTRCSTSASSACTCDACGSGMRPRITAMRLINSEMP